MENQLVIGLEFSNKLTSLLEAFFNNTPLQHQLKDVSLQKLDWRYDLLMVDWERFVEEYQGQELLTVLSAKPAIVFFVEEKSPQYQQLELVLEHRQNVLGAIKYPKTNLEQLSMEKSISTFWHYLYERKKFRKELESLTQALRVLTNDVENEVQRVKGIHRKLVPKRFEKIKGLQVHGKFMAGQYPGGEYFDLCRSQNALILMMSSTNSYLLSSAVISSFINFKNEQKVNEKSLEEIHRGLERDYQYLKDVDANCERSYLLVYINLKTLEMNGIVKGDYDLVSLDKGPMWDRVVVEKDKKFNFSNSLSRGERVSFLSPGLRKNWQNYVREPIEAKMAEIKDSDLVDFTEELMIKLQMEAQKEFLDFDASVVSLEVSKNVIVQI